jgi:hypothetical protein
MWRSGKDSFNAFDFQPCQLMRMNPETLQLLMCYLRHLSILIRTHLPPRSFEGRLNANTFMTSMSRVWKK